MNILNIRSLSKKNVNILDNVTYFLFFFIFFFQVYILLNWAKFNLSFLQYVFFILALEFFLKETLYKNIFLEEIFNKIFNKISDKKKLFNQLSAVIFIICTIFILLLFLFNYHNKINLFFSLIPIFIINGFLINFSKLINVSFTYLIITISKLIFIYLMIKNLNNYSILKFSITIYLLNFFEIIMLLFFIKGKEILVSISNLNELINFRTITIYKKIIISTVITNQINILFLIFLITSYIKKINIVDCTIYYFLITQLGNLIFKFSKNKYNLLLKSTNEDSINFNKNSYKLILINLSISLLICTVYFYFSDAIVKILFNYFGAELLTLSKITFKYVIFILPIYLFSKSYNLIIYSREENIKYKFFFIVNIVLLSLSALLITFVLEGY